MVLDYISVIIDKTNDGEITLADQNIEAICERNESIYNSLIATYNQLEAFGNLLARTHKLPGKYRKLRNSLDVDNPVPEYRGNKVLDRSIAAELNAFYTMQGLNKGWKDPKTVKPLTEEPETIQQKNVDAMENTILYWIKVFDGVRNGDGTYNNDFNALEIMATCVVYESHREYSHLEEASNEQHIQWGNFVSTHEKRRIDYNPNHRRGFSPANYDKKNQRYNPKTRRQFMAPYYEEAVINPDGEIIKGLTEDDRDLDRIVVAVTTDRILARALNGKYQQHYDVSEQLNQMQYTPKQRKKRLKAA